MKQLNIATTYALRDKFNAYSDIRFYERITNLISGCWLIDRTQTVELPFKTQLMQEHILPDLSSITSLSLEECCFNRATELLSLDSTLYFLYSGGIDSTLALVSLIKAGATPDQLAVVCNPDSIRENPNFYNTYIREQFKLISSELFMQHIKTQKLNGIIIGCEPGDALHGQYLGSMALDLFGGEYLNRPATRENILDFFKAKGLEEQIANCCFDIYTNNISMSLRPINTVYDFFWWTHFNWRWQSQCEKFKLRTPLSPDIETFYSTIEFQKWSVNHTQRTIKKHSDFKQDFKDIIFDFTADYEYFNSKIKHISVSHFYLTDAFVAIDADGTKLRPNEFLLMDYYQEDNFIANWIRDN
jgi:hypothetical protein